MVEEDVLVTAVVVTCSRVRKVHCSSFASSHLRVLILVLQKFVVQIEIVVEFVSLSPQVVVLKIGCL